MKSHTAQRTLLQMAAATTIIAGVLFSLTPIIITLPLAFVDQVFLGLPSGTLTGKWFARLNLPMWRQAVGTSLLLAMSSSAIAVFLAALAAYHTIIRPRTSTSGLLRSMIVTVLIVPPIWIGTGILRLAGEDGALGLILPHALLGLPPAFVCVWYGMSRLNPELIQAAEMLGASHWAILTRIYLPSIRTYVVAALFVAFLTSWDETVFPLLLTGPETHTLPKTAFETMRLDRDWTVAAVNFVTVAALSMILYRVLKNADESLG